MVARMLSLAQQCDVATKELSSAATALDPMRSLRMGKR